MSIPYTRPDPSNRKSSRDDIVYDANGGLQTRYQL